MTKRLITLDEVAIQLGLSPSLRSNAVIIATTGQVTAEARSFAASILRTNAFPILMFGRDDLNALAGNTEPEQAVAFLLSRKPDLSSRTEAGLMRLWS
jgi:lipocalin